MERYRPVLATAVDALEPRRFNLGGPVGVSGAELDAYVDLLRGGDGGRAFAQIRRRFERTDAKAAPPRTRAQ